MYLALRKSNYKLKKNIYIVHFSACLYLWWKENNMWVTLKSQFGYFVVLCIPRSGEHPSSYTIENENQGVNHSTQAAAAADWIGIINTLQDIWFFK